MYDSQSIDTLTASDMTFYEHRNGQNPKDAKLSKREALTYEAIEFTKLRNSHYYESDHPVTVEMEKQMAWLLYKSFQRIDDLYANNRQHPLIRVFKRIRLFIERNILAQVMRVRVYDHYVENIRPALRFRNKIRHAFGLWIPIGADSPFGRLVDTKATAAEANPIIKYFTRLSDMGKNFQNNGIEYNVTHWRESRNTD